MNKNFLNKINKFKKEKIKLKEQLQIKRISHCELKNILGKSIYIIIQNSSGVVFTWTWTWKVMVDYNMA